MQLTEHRHGLWGSIGFSSTRGQIAVQVSFKLGDWAGFTQLPAARRLFPENLHFPFEIEIQFLGILQQFALWDTPSGSQNMSHHSQHHLKRNHGCRSRWETSTLFRIALASGWAGVRRADMRAAGPGLVWLQKGGKVQLWGSYNQDCLGNLPQGLTLVKAGADIGFS